MELSPSRLPLLHVPTPCTWERSQRQPETPILPRLPPTIVDVARLAGCSKSTVSRYLTGSPRLAPSTRTGIAEAIGTLGYRPSAVGRSLHRNLSPTIGLLVPSVTNPIFASTIAGVQDRARGSDLSVILATSDYDPAVELAAVQTLISHRVSGLVLTLCNPDRCPSLDLVDAERVPYVLLFNQPAGERRPAVSVDNAGAAGEMTRAILDLGHRRIAFLAVHFSGSDRSRRRHDGYVAAMAEAGIAAIPPLEVGFLADEDAKDRIRTLFSGPDRPTALLCSTDILALSAIAVIRDLGLGVPEDVSVAGFDGIAIGSLVSPPLATVMQPTYDMGRWAMDLLSSRLAGDPLVASAPLPHQLRLGGTLASVAQRRLDP